MIHNREMGWKLDGVGFVLDVLALGIGTTRENFQPEGTLALDIDRLNNWASTGAISQL